MPQSPQFFVFLALAHLFLAVFIYELIFAEFGIYGNAQINYLKYIHHTNNSLANINTTILACNSLTYLNGQSPKEYQGIWPQVGSMTRGNSSSCYIFQEIRLVNGDGDHEWDVFLKGTFEAFLKTLNHTFEKLAPDSQLLFVEVQTRNQTVTNKIPDGKNEGYGIHFTNSVLIETETIFGVIRALATLRQLIHETEYGCIVTHLPIEIHDAPAMAFRGILIDSAREFWPVESLKRVVDMLWFLKMNVIHWHVTDDQSAPIESFTHPNMTIGLSQDEQQIYTQEDVKQFVEYARLRGVRIIPEFDMPGHAGAFAYEEGLLSQCPSHACSKAYSLSMNPLNNRTFEVLEEYLTEMSQLFIDPWIHLGGDEVSACWKEVYSKDTREDFEPSRDKLCAIFEQGLQKIIDKLSLNVIRWHESLPHINHKSLIIQDWRDKVHYRSQLPESVQHFAYIPVKGWYLDFTHCKGGWRQTYDQTPFHSFHHMNSFRRTHFLGSMLSAWETSPSLFRVQKLYLNIIAGSERLWTPPLSPPPSSPHSSQRSSPHSSGESSISDSPLPGNDEQNLNSSMNEEKLHDSPLSGQRWNPDSTPLIYRKAREGRAGWKVEQIRKETVALWLRIPESVSLRLQEMCERFIKQIWWDTDRKFNSKVMLRDEPWLLDVQWTDVERCLDYEKEDPGSWMEYKYSWKKSWYQKMKTRHESTVCHRFSSASGRGRGMCLTKHCQKEGVKFATIRNSEWGNVTGEFDVNSTLSVLSHQRPARVRRNRGKLRGISGGQWASGGAGKPQRKSDRQL